MVGTISNGEVGLSVRTKLNELIGEHNAHLIDTANPHAVTKDQVGLGNVDNTTDALKPVSTATQAALDLKIPLTQKAAASGVATLDSNTKVPLAQINGVNTSAGAADAGKVGLLDAGGHWAASMFDPLATRDVISKVSTSVAAAATLDLTSSPISGEWVPVTGTGATITAVTLAEGNERWVRFSGDHTIQVGASLVGDNNGANVAIKAGDIVYFRAGNSDVVYFRTFPVKRNVAVSAGAADGGVNIATTAGGTIDPTFFNPLVTRDAVSKNSTSIAAAATLDLQNSPISGEHVVVTGTGVTITAITLDEGNERWVQFTGSHTFQVGSLLVGDNGGADVDVVSGDFIYVRAGNSGVKYFRTFPATRATLSLPELLTVETVSDIPPISVSTDESAVWSVTEDGRILNPEFDTAFEYAKSASPRARVGIDGDSRSDLCSNANATRAQGWLGWAHILSGARFQFKPEWNNGVGGQDSGELMRRAGLMAAMPVDVVVAICSTNERTAGETVDWTFERLSRYQNLILRSGKKLIWICETPRGGQAADAPGHTYDLDPPELGDSFMVRRWQKSQANVKNVAVLDMGDISYSPFRTDGRALDTILRDGIHWGAYFAFYIGQRLTGILNTWFPPFDILPVTNSDVWSTDNPYGSLTPNPMLEGTGGTGGGSVADDWTVVAASGLTATNTKVTVGNRTHQRIVVGGTGATGVDGTDSAGNPDPQNVSVLFEADLNTSGMDDGDSFRAVCGVKVDSGATGLRAVCLYIEYTTGSGTFLVGAMEPDTTRSQINLDCPGEEWEGVLETVETGPISGVTSARLFVGITGAEFSGTAAPVAAAVEIWAIEAVKII